jgi:hypothetical protein
VRDKFSRFYFIPNNPHYQEYPPQKEIKGILEFRDKFITEKP